MDGIQEMIAQAYREEDWSYAIQLYGILDASKRQWAQRQIVKTLIENSKPERKETTYDYLFITVNPNPELCSLDVFRILCNKVVTKKWLTSYVYVIEQRGTNQETKGKGYHMHMILKKPERKSSSHIIREIASTFNKVCDVSNFHFYNTKWISEEEYQRKLKYILGEKESTDSDRKDLKQEMDKIWRQEVGIQQKYFSNIELGQYA